MLISTQEIVAEHIEATFFDWPISADLASGPYAIMLQDAATPTLFIMGQLLDLFSPTYHKHQAQKVML